MTLYLLTISILLNITLGVILYYVLNDKPNGWYALKKQNEWLVMKHKEFVEYHEQFKIEE